MTTKLFTVVATQTRRVDVVYEVEARDEDEARKKVHSEETVSEERFEESMTLIDRSIISVSESDPLEDEESA